MGMRCNTLGKVLDIEQKETKNGKEFWSFELDVSGSKESAFPVRFSCWDSKLFSKLAEISPGQIVALDAVAKPFEHGDRVFVNWEVASIFAYGSSKGKQTSNPPQRETAPPKQQTRTSPPAEDEDDVPF